MKRNISANKTVEAVERHPLKVAITDEATGQRVELTREETENLQTVLDRIISVLLWEL